MKDAIITSSVLILCMVLLRRLCRKKISAKLQYMLWLVVAIRLVMPGIIVFWPNLLPESAYSVLNAADRMERAAQEYIRPSEQPVQGSLPSKGLPFLTEENADGKVVTYLTDQTMWLRFLEKVWYLGMAAIAFWMIAVNFRFMRRLYESRRRYQREGFELPVYTTKELSSPCLYGMPGRQAVYLPEDMTEDENGVRHILAHEYCHYKQKDILWSLLRCILLTVYWFHPLVWLAAVLSKQDCELACDEAAVRMLGGRADCLWKDPRFPDYKENKSRRHGMHGDHDDCGRKGHKRKASKNCRISPKAGFYYRTDDYRDCSCCRVDLYAVQRLSGRRFSAGRRRLHDCDNGLFSDNFPGFFYRKGILPGGERYRYYRLSQRFRSGSGPVLRGIL